MTVATRSVDKMADWVLAPYRFENLCRDMIAEARRATELSPEQVAEFEAMMRRWSAESRDRRGGR